MFGWFKKRAYRERIKLLFQNHTASEQLRYLAELAGNTAVEQQLAASNKRNHEIALKEMPSTEDVEFLLSTNKQLRILFDEEQKNGSMAKIASFAGQKHAPKSFDETFRPILGWEDYYNAY